MWFELFPGQNLQKEEENEIFLAIKRLYTWA